MLKSHLLAIIILLVAPLFSYIMIRFLKRNKSENSRINSYILTIIILWTVFVMIFTQHGYIFLYHGPSISKSAVPFILIYIFLMTLLPFIFVKNQTFRSALFDAYKNKSHIYPISRKERAWFCLVAITVGICEEVFYRSFLL